MDGYGRRHSRTSCQDMQVHSFYTCPKLLTQASSKHLFSPIFLLHRPQVGIRPRQIRIDSFVANSDRMIHELGIARSNRDV